MTSDEQKVMQEALKVMKQWNNSALHYAFDFCERHEGKFWEELREHIRQEIINKGGRT